MVRVAVVRERDPGPVHGVGDRLRRVRPGEELDAGLVQVVEHERDLEGVARAEALHRSG